MIRERTAARSRTEITQQNTPMIDVVFQLLTFFVMSFKVISLEGDFNVKMPVAERGFPPHSETHALHVRLEADSAGELKRISLNGRALEAGDWRGVRNTVVSALADDRGPGIARDDLEVTLDCDTNLRYEFAVQAITSVSGEIDASGRVTPLASRVKFAPPRNEKK